MKKKGVSLLVDAHVFDEIYQGTRTFLKGIYTHLNIEDEPITVYLAANNIENLKVEFKDVKGIEFLKLKYKNKYIRLAYEIPKLIKDLNIDFAHFNYYLPLFLNKNCKYVVTIHDVLFLDYPEFFPKGYYLKNKFFFKQSAKKAEIVTTVSEYAAQRIKENLQVKNKRVHVLPNAVDEKYQKQYNKEVHKEYIKSKYKIENYILYVSRLEPRKNHQLVLKTYDKLNLWDQNIELVFIGKKSIDNKYLEDKINIVNEKSNNKVHHLEYVDDKDLIPFYNAATVAVFPSICEGFGIPPLESGALQTPTICSNLTAMKDFDFFGENHINPNDELSFKKALIKLVNKIENHDLDRKKANSISNTIFKRYNWNKTANILKTIILDIY